MSLRQARALSAVGGLLLAAATAAIAGEGSCGNGRVGFRFEDDSPSLAIVVNRTKLYDATPSGLAEVTDRFEAVPSRDSSSLRGTGGSWSPVGCSFQSTWVAWVQWTTTVDVAGSPVRVRWRTIVSADPSEASSENPHLPSNAVEWMLEVEGWPRFAADEDTLAFGVLLRPTASDAANGGPDFVVLPPVAGYDGTVGDASAALCSSTEYRAAPNPPCPNRFAAFDVCDKCVVAEVNLGRFDHEVRYPQPP